MARNMLRRRRDFRFVFAGGELDAGETDSNKTYRLHFLLHYGLQPKRYEPGMQLSLRERVRGFYGGEKSALAGGGSSFE